MSKLAIIKTGAKALLPFLGSGTEEIYKYSPESYAFKQQSQFAEKMAIDAFNREAEYNSPLAQMERFKEAGLNPHLIYGQGNSGNVSASSPSASHAAPAGIRDLMPMLMQVAGFLKEMEVKDAQINSLNVGASQKEASTMLTSEQLSQMRERFPLLFTKLVNEIGLQGSQFDAMTLKNKETQQKIANLALKGDYDKKANPLKIQQLDNMINNMLLQGTLMTKDMDIKDKILQSKGFENQLLEAQSALTEQGITNPQALGQLLLTLLFQAFRK